MQIKNELLEYHAEIVTYILDELIPIPCLELTFNSHITSTENDCFIRVTFTFKENENGKEIHSYEIAKRYGVSQIHYQRLRQELFKKVYDLHGFFKKHNLALWSAVEITQDGNGEVRSRYSYDDDIDDVDFYYTAREFAKEYCAVDDEKGKQYLEEIEKHLEKNGHHVH